MSVERRRAQVERGHPKLSIRRQCQLLDICRSGWYHKPKDQPDDDLRLKRLMDEQYLKAPWHGSRGMVRALTQIGERVNRKRVQRLMCSSRDLI